MPKLLLINDTQDLVRSLSQHDSLILRLIEISSGSEDQIHSEVTSEYPDLILVGPSQGNAVVKKICKELELRDETSCIPLIIVCPKHEGSEYYPELSACGADSFLHTPIENDELMAQISAMLRIKDKNDRLIREKNELETLLEEKNTILGERTYDLGKRVKELNCLYSISKLRERPGISIEEILAEVAELIPSSWQYSDITCARIIMGYQEFKTENFIETPWRQSCDITVNGEWAGTLEVYYLVKPESGGGFFLKEESDLLGAIAERLGKIAERVRAEDALRLESKNILNILKSMEDLVYKVNEQYEIEYVNPALEHEFGPAQGRVCYEYFRENKTPCSDCKLDAVFGGKTVRREWVFPRNGKIYDVLDTPLRNPDGSLSKLSILRDVTALKNAQKDLEEREMLYRNVTEFIAEGAVMVQGGKILFANNTFADMFGCQNSKELDGVEITDFFDKDFRELFRRVFDASENDEDLGSTLRGIGVSREGRKFWVSTNRSIISLKTGAAILAAIRDDTEQVMWERSMQEETDYLRRENIKLRSSIKERYRFGEIIGKSRPMQEVYELILRAAGSEANVLILGESGTGKELVARAVHEMSSRGDNSFVPVNCGAIPENLVESEFFGHVKGAFTGAHINKTGYLHTADGGTLFLDEVGELGLTMQVKLLRALESGEYNPVGDTKLQRSHARIIAATNRDFSAMVAEGKLRQDFYYRISVLPIVLPPLREKKEDIPLLVEHFLGMYCKDKKIPTIPGKIMEVLNNHDWPGNVRELQSVIQRYLAVGNFHFLKINGLHEKMEEDVYPDVEPEIADLKEATLNFERRYILAALNKRSWKRGRVAAELGIDPKTLYVKMKKIGLS